MNNTCEAYNKKEQHKLERLLANSTTWPTNMGGWQPGKDVSFRGKSLLKDLNHLSWMSLIIYAITGKEPEPKQLELYEGIWVISTSFPDPRLWNNRIAALAGTSRSTVNLGVSAGIAVSEATIYGHRPLLAAIDFLKKNSTAVSKGRGSD